MVRALPRALADPRPAVGAGTIVWFIVAAIVLFSGGAAAWFWACLTGGLLGLSGFAMIHWQRRSAQRGTRSAQQGLL